MRRAAPSGPGKVTLTEQLGPVMRRSHGSASEATQAGPGNRPADGPSAIFGDAVAGTPTALPFRAEMERAFGEDFSGVRVHVGKRDAMAALGASAAALGDEITFESSNPDRATVAHELAHVVQHRRGSIGGAADSVSSPGDAAEIEAESVGQAVAAGGPAKVHAAKSSAIHRAPPTSPAPAAGVTPPPAPGLPPGVTPPPAPEKGDHEKANIGSWDRFTSISTTTTIGIYNTEAEAMAAAHTMGAVILETGRYVAYRIVTGALLESFTWDNCVVVRSGDLSRTWSTVEIKVPWIAVTTQDSIVLRPSQYDGDAARKVMTPEMMLKPGESPFGGFDKLMGPTAKIADEQLISAFTAAMKKGALGILASSEVEVAKKRAQFQGKKTGADEFQLIRETAKKLAKLDDAIALQTSLSTLPVDRLDHDAAEQRKQKAAAAREKERLILERAKVLTEYPMLARQDPKQIQGSDDDIAKRLGDDTIKISKDIVDTRNNLLDGSLEVWGIESLIDTTIAGCGITDPARRQKIKDHAASEKKWNTVKTVTKTVFAIGLGLIAAFSTGGLALVAAAGSLGLSTYDAMKTTKDYAVDGAAANTNLDPQMALAFHDMDHRWIEVAVAWVGVGLDLGAVATALKGVKSIAEVAQAADQLAKGSMTLLTKLRAAAGIFKEGEVITELTRGALALRVGASVEIRQGLGTEVHVLYEIEESTKRVVVKGVVAGEKALAKDVLEHGGTVKLLTRYEGVSGKLRELWERMLSIGGKRGGDKLKNPFTPGTQAFESWLETKKLPGIIESRLQGMSKKAGELTKDAEEALAREIKVLEDDLARHQANVDRLAAEEGTGFIAKSEEATAAAESAGWPKKKDLPVPAQDRQYYYYRRKEPNSFELCTMQDAPAGVKRLTLQGEGKSAQVVEGAQSAAQKGKLLVEGFDKNQKAAWDSLVKLEEEAGVHRVVPLKGIGKAEAKIGQAFSPTQQRQMVDLYKRAWKAKNPALTEAAANKLAESTVAKVMNKDVVLVQGTEQLRLFDYAAKAKKAGTPIGEFHHDIPLYLGGDHTLLTDIGKVKNAKGELVDLHDELHALISQAEFKGGGTLAPTDLAKKIPTSPGAAVLKIDGSIDFYVFNGKDAVKL